MMREDEDDGEDASADDGKIDGREPSWDDLAEAPLEFDPSNPMYSMRRRHSG